MPGHAGYLAILDEMRALHEKKAADYGNAADPFANVRASEQLGVPAWVGAVLRANDKITRIKSFIENGKLKNESVEDSLLDAAAYFLIALAIRRDGEAHVPMPRNYSGVGRRKRPYVKRSHVSSEAAADSTFDESQPTEATEGKLVGAA